MALRKRQGRGEGRDPSADKKRRHSRRGPGAADVFQAEDADPVEEQQAGRRYDVPGAAEYELASDFSGEDEEIDEDEAFTAEDNEKYGSWVAASGEVPEHENQGAEAELEEGEYNTDDFSEDEAEEHAAAPGSDAEEDADPGSSDDERHRQLLQAVTGQQTGSRRRVQQQVMTEAYPESEANLPPVQSASGARLTVADLISGLGRGASKMGGARRELERLARRAAPVAPPLPGPIQARQRRQAGYEAMTQDVSKWQPVVKANREAPTLQLEREADVPKPTSSLAGLAASLQPQSAMERDIQAMLTAAGAASGSKVEAAEEALALKTLTAEEARARQNALAQMRSLLLHHSDKARHLKNIKSKDFHRRANRAARLKARKLGEEGEEGYVKLAAEQAELERARERLTLRHKNSSRWARRALKRGYNVMDEGTKHALDEQLRLGQELKRRVDKVEGTSGKSGEQEGSSDASTEASDDDEADQKEPAGDGLSQRARRQLREGALDIIQGKDGEAEAAPSKGLMSLPFMRRAMERQRLAAQADAAAVLRELDSQDAASGDNDDDDDDAHAGQLARAPGRLSFGGPAAAASAAELDGADSGSDGDASDEFEDAEARIAGRSAAAADQDGSTHSAPQQRMPSPITPHQTSRRLATEPAALAAAFSAAGKTAPQSHDSERLARQQDASPAAAFHHNGGKPGHTAADGVSVSIGPASAKQSAPSKVAVTADDEVPKSGKKGRRRAGHVDDRVAANMEAVATAGADAAAEASAQEPAHTMQPIKGMDLSQRELIAAAFAGDDVQADFDAAKAAEAEAEAPVVEEPAQLPGWGAWAAHQRKPQWLLTAKARAAAKREAALAARKDASMKGVIVSERCDRKAARYATSGLPHPFTSRQAYERQMRQPMGPDYNTSASHRDFIRPAVLKTAGVMIKPIKYSQLASQQGAGANHKHRQHGTAVANGHRKAKAGRK